MVQKKLIMVMMMMMTATNIQWALNICQIMSQVFDLDGLL